MLDKMRAEKILSIKRESVFSQYFYLLDEAVNHPERFGLFQECCAINCSYDRRSRWYTVLLIKLMAELLLYSLSNVAQYKVERIRFLFLPVCQCSKLQNNIGDCFIWSQKQNITVSLTFRSYQKVRVNVEPAKW